MDEETASDILGSDNVQLGPSVIPEEGLDDLSFFKALAASMLGVFVLGVVFAVGAALLGKTILKRLLKN